MLTIVAVAYLAVAATPGRASMCSDAYGMSDEIRKAILDKHNELRSLTAKGLAVNYQGGHAPKAARMLKMSYDCDIEANTMNWIKQCKWGHNSYRERNKWGQNLYRINAKVNKTSAAVKSVERWFSELTKKGLNPKDNNKFTNAAFLNAGHYTQVVWQKSHKLGCAVYWCPQMTYVGCEYSPAGNMRKAVIYDVGEPCKKDEDCRGDNAFTMENWLKEEMTISL
ncbi:C-type single domain activation associated secreted protein ASP3 [Trichostrongylus colubriformis]|uniref:C-type single domain activation associated secreted protein ASP3 n=1 Tax=Trichostrongylus colubriformis TaxID=6319 RepID=A0AAN8IJ75_TRICO